MYYFLLLILFLLVMSYFREEGYLNYEELSFKGVKKNCPQIHANNFNRIVSPDRLEQFFGDYASEFSDIDPKKKEPEKIDDKSDNKLEKHFASCLGALKIIKDGWETEAIPEKGDKNIEKMGIFLINVTVSLTSLPQFLKIFFQYAFFKFFPS